MRIAVVNGPNLDLLGEREKHIYGSVTLEDLRVQMQSRAADLGVDLDWFQSNHEGELIETVHGFREATDGAIVNLGAFTHTSWALRDAFLAVRIPFIELHISNVFARESERQRSLIADLARGYLSGFGPRGYLLALDALTDILRDG